jgi:hypothetical protein
MVAHVVGLPDKVPGCRSGGRREPRAGARGAGGDRPVAAAQADHGQPVAGRPAQGRLALRPADRARPARRDRRDPAETLAGYVAVGELGLDGSDRAGRPACCRPRSTPRRAGLGLICPAAAGPEAAWAGEIEIVAAPDLIALLNHFKGTQRAVAAAPGEAERRASGPTSPRSRARRAPSARSRSPRPAATIC